MVFVLFVMLLNFVFVFNVDSKDVFWVFILCYVLGVMVDSNLKFDELVGYVIWYFEDFVKLMKLFKVVDDVEW